MDQHAVTVGSLLLITALLFLPSRRNPFVYEDLNVPTMPQQAHWALPGRALSAWSLGLTARNAERAHEVNLALHLISGVLVALVAYRMAGPVAMVGAAAVFLLHPLNSQAVLYVIGREDVQMTVCVLLAVMAVLWRGWWSWPAAAGALLMSAETKEIGLVGVPLVALTVLSVHGMNRWATCAVALIVAVVGVCAYSHAYSLIMQPAGQGGAAVPWAEFVVRQAGMTWALLWRLVWPVNLSIDHDALALSVGQLRAAALLTVTALTTCVWAWRRRPILAWSIAWVAISLAPRLLIGSSEFVSERQLYLPMVGVSVGLGALVAHPFNPRRVMKGC